MVPASPTCAAPAPLLLPKASPDSFLPQIKYSAANGSHDTVRFLPPGVVFPLRSSFISSDGWSLAALAAPYPAEPTALMPGASQGVFT